MKSITVFQLQVPAMMGFHSICDWYYQTMWLLLSVPEEIEDQTVMDMCGAGTLHSPVKS